MKKFTIILVLNLSILESSIVSAHEFCEQGSKLRCLLDPQDERNLVCTFEGKCSKDEQANLPNLAHKTVAFITQEQMEQLKERDEL